MRLRIRLSVLLSALVTLLAVGTVAGTPAAASTELETGPFRVINYNSGLCIDVANKSTSDNATVHQWDCHGEAHQLWHFKYQPTGGRFMMIPHHTYAKDPQGCLTNPQWSTTNGEDMKLYGCFPAPWAASHQGWSLVTEGGSALPKPNPQLRYRFINWKSGMCLEIENGSQNKGGRAQQAPCDGSKQQLWIVTN